MKSQDHMKVRFWHSKLRQFVPCSFYREMEKYTGAKDALHINMESYKKS